MPSPHDINANDPHTRAVLICWAWLVIPLGLMALTRFFVPGQDVFMLSPAFYWIFSVLTWVGWIGWAPLAVLGILTIHADLGDYMPRTKLRFRLLFRRIVLLLAWFFAGWLIALGSIWLALVAFPNA